MCNSQLATRNSLLLLVRISVIVFWHMALSLLYMPCLSLSTTRLSLSTTRLSLSCIWLSLSSTGLTCLTWCDMLWFMTYFLLCALTLWTDCTTSLLTLLALLPHYSHCCNILWCMTYVTWWHAVLSAHSWWHAVHTLDHLFRLCLLFTDITGVTTALHALVYYRFAATLLNYCMSLRAIGTQREYPHSTKSRRFSFPIFLVAGPWTTPGASSICGNQRGLNGSSRLHTVCMCVCVSVCVCVCDTVLCVCV